MDIYLAYLRKSRMDKDYETVSLEETLKRHRAQLLELAERMGIVLKEENIYEEVVSGESIASRPEIQKVLERVSSENIKGVLCIDTERLSRGDSIDSGIIQNTFMYSNTLIITPSKTYDLSNENDEQYMGMSLMFAHWELNTIRRRLFNGRCTSASEGKYVGSVAPYGYMIKKIEGDKGNTLVPNPEESEVVKLIFNLYVYDNLGYEKIAKKLNSLHYRTRSGALWTKSTISNIVKNPCYIGKIRWQYSKLQKTLVNGNVKKNRVVNNRHPVYKGLHKPIIDEEVFMLAQKKLHTNFHKPVGEKSELKNPFAGIFFCKKCGYRIERYTTTKGKIAFRCTNKYCESGISMEPIVVDAIKKSLSDWMRGYKATLEIYEEPKNNLSIYENSINKIREELSVQEKQLENAKIFLEKEIYSLEEYLERKESLSSSIANLKESIETLSYEKEQLESESCLKDNILPKTEFILDSWDSLSPQALNDVLSEILVKIEYEKDKLLIGEKRKPLHIHVYPRLPKGF